MKAGIFTLFVRCRTPKGRFTYEGQDICFESDAFERFGEQLDAMKAGRAAKAELVEAGRMLSLKLTVKGHSTNCSIRIREAQAANEMTLLSAGFKVDYDLFVNKMSGDVMEFSRKLREIRPQRV